MGTQTVIQEAEQHNGSGEKSAQGSVLPKEDEYTILSSGMRIFLVVLLGVVTILSTLTTTIYFPLIPMLSTQLSVSIQAINLTATVYGIFQAVSPAFFASFSDSFGRRPVLLGVILIYACASLGLVINSYSYAVLVVLRALQSTGGSAIPPLAYRVVADAAVTPQRGAMLGPMLSICNGISAVGAVALGASGMYGRALPETARCIVRNGSKPAAGVYKTWWAVISAGTCHKTDAEIAYATLGSHLAGKKKGKWTVYGAWSISDYRDPRRHRRPVDDSNVVFGIGPTFLPGLVGMALGGIVARKLLDRSYAHVAKANGINIDHKKAQDVFHFQ
ncbi:hypothetical protein O1611_g2471 [Lasiodiplodia mahajangana]|uniref:Uncharacterized protein n=1 Tax=Lasiodiplodia mahajangana TaxID=1108764 RepID=A0ACC2JUF5_9PEZI|nr:hypothetical protein O1611_g2471 [Lasiodiplodia mahajangana]